MEKIQGGLDGRAGYEQVGDCSSLSTPPAQRRMVGADVVQDWQGGQDIVEEAKLNVAFLFGRWKVIDVLPLDVEVRVNVADSVPVRDRLARQVVDPAV